MEPDRLLDGLNDAQRRAVTSSVVPMCVLAGAGSGKTRVLTRRIAYRAATDQHDPRRVLALTFTRKAAGELTSRLRQLGLRDAVAAGTFHAVAYAQLRSRWADRRQAEPGLLDKKVGFVARLMPSTAHDVVPLDLVTEIEWAKARDIGPDQYPSAAKAAGRKPAVDVREVARTYDRYEKEKRERHVVDFDDLLAQCANHLRDDRAFADAQRWRFRHFFVDEYQDVNPLQQRLLEAWLGDRTDLCVVGDANQAIYTWNGADTRYLVDFTQRWQRGEVVSLDDNYRSTQQVLAVANAVLNDSRAGRRAAERGEQIGALRANRADGPPPVVTAYPDDGAEAAGIARAVRDRAAGRAWSSQAVLVRTNAQIVLIQEALRRAQIPYRVKGGSSLLDQPDIKALLRDVARAREPFATTLADLEALARRRADEQRAEAAARDADDGADDQGFVVDERVTNVEELVRLGHEYAALDPYASAASFVDWLRGLQAGDHPDAAGDAVEIATFHAAKGLEWPTVHLAGLESGYVPIAHAKTAAELLEERRLFYVAVTRAERELVCSWAQARTFGTRTTEREPSPYLATVEAATDALATDAAPATDRAPWVRDGDSAARARALRNGRVGGALSTLAPKDQALLDALGSWRAGLARAAATAETVVCHDTTLEAIARARPTDTDALAAVPGIGPLKASRYAPTLLPLIAAHTP